MSGITKKPHTSPTPVASSSIRFSTPEQARGDSLRQQSCDGVIPPPSVNLRPSSRERIWDLPSGRDVRACVAGTTWDNHCGGASSPNGLSRR